MNYGNLSNSELTDIILTANYESDDDMNNAREAVSYLKSRGVIPHHLDLLEVEERQAVHDLLNE